MWMPLLSIIGIAVISSLPGTLVARTVDDHPKRMKCMDTNRHKPTSSPENLPKLCNMYSSNSCCSNSTVEAITEYLYPFKRVSCKELSSECMKFFLKDACFFECSPDLGPWLKENEEKKEVTKNIPLCKSECDAWFSACSNDLTCAVNWNEALNNQEHTSCKSKTCKTIKDTFKTADNFCRKVWDGSYDVADDSPSCVKINIELHDDNGKHPGDDKNSGHQNAYSLVVVAVTAMVSASWYV